MRLLEGLFDSFEQQALGGVDSIKEGSTFYSKSVKNRVFLKLRESNNKSPRKNVGYRGPYFLLSRETLYAEGEYATPGDVGIRSFERWLLLFFRLKSVIRQYFQPPPVGSNVISAAKAYLVLVYVQYIHDTPRSSPGDVDDEGNQFSTWSPRIHWTGWVKPLSEIPTGGCQWCCFFMSVVKTSPSEAIPTAIGSVFLSTTVGKSKKKLRFLPKEWYHDDPFDWFVKGDGWGFRETKNGSKSRKHKSPVDIKAPKETRRLRLVANIGNATA